MRTQKHAYGYRPLLPMADTSIAIRAGFPRWRLLLDVVLSAGIPCWGFLGGVVVMGVGDAARGSVMVLAGIAGLLAYLAMLAG